MVARRLIVLNFDDKTVFWDNFAIRSILHMKNGALLSRITLNPDVCFGKPTVRNMRYPVAFILDLLSAGMSHQEILDDYADLEEDDIKACLFFASKLMQVNSIHKVHAA